MDELNGSGNGSENVHTCILFVIIYIIATVNMKKLKKMGKKRSRNKNSSLLLVHTVRTVRAHSKCLFCSNCCLMSEILNRLHKLY